jgi:hypothetical protein
VLPISNRKHVWGNMRSPAAHIFGLKPRTYARAYTISLTHEPLHCGGTDTMPWTSYPPATELVFYHCAVPFITHSMHVRIARAPLFPGRSNAPPRPALLSSLVRQRTKIDAFCIISFCWVLYNRSGTPLFGEHLQGALTHCFLFHFDTIDAGVTSCYSQKDVKYLNFECNNRQIAILSKL